MKIFNIIRSLKKAIKTYEKDYTIEYVSGYIDCLGDLQGRIEESRNLGLVNRLKIAWNLIRFGVVEIRGEKKQKKTEIDITTTKK